MNVHAPPMLAASDHVADAILAGIGRDLRNLSGNEITDLHTLRACAADAAQLVGEGWFDGAETLEALRDVTLAAGALPEDQVNGILTMAFADHIRPDDIAQSGTANPADGFRIAARRKMAAAVNGDRLAVFQSIALECAVAVATATLENYEAGDLLHDLAETSGLTDEIRTDDLQHIIAEGLRGRAATTARADHGDNRANEATLPATDLRLVIRRMSDVQPEKIEWLWRNRIAIGKQTLIGGEPGLGKSQLMAAMAAAVTTGGEWPCGEGYAPQGSVVILSAEDDAADTIRPRLDAAGADASRVYQISAVEQRDGKGRRTFNLQADLLLLEKTVRDVGDVRLVIIDPVSSYMGKTDSHKNADVRGTLEPLGDMASRLRVAVVAITHFSKGSGNSALNSFIGSIAFIAAARAAFMVTRDPESEDTARRLFVTAKNNLAADSGGLAFRVEQQLLPNDIVASAIVWDGERITRTADEILAAVAEDKSGSPTRAEAEDFLKDILSAGPVPAKDIEAEAKGAGISWRTIRRAQKVLGVRAERRAESGDGLGKSGRWYWGLPGVGDAPKAANFPYDGHVSDVAALGNSGRLRDDREAE